MGGSHKRGACGAMVSSRRRFQGREYPETAPLGHVCSEAQPCCCERQVSEGSTLSGSMHSKEGTAACSPRAQGRGCVTAGKILPMAVPTSMYGQKQRLSLIAKEHSHIRLFRCGFVYIERETTPRTPQKQQKGKLKEKANKKPSEF